MPSLDPTPFLELAPAPQAVFDHLEARRGSARFMVRDGTAGEDGAARDWRPVLWEEYASSIARVAVWLATHGLGREDRAAILAPNRVAWMEAALGIQAAGGAMVPIYASSTADQIAYVLTHSDARCVFVDTPALLERLLSRPDGLEGVQKIVYMGEDSAGEQRHPKLLTWSALHAQAAGMMAAEPERFEALLAAVELDQMGLMLYTSGTSGRPKGVPLTHRNIASNGQDWLTCNAPQLGPAGSDVDLLWLPMSHIFGFGEACLGNALGFTSYMCTPLEVLERLPEVRPTVFMSVPLFWEKIATLAREHDLAAVTGGRLRFCLSGGAGLEQGIKEELLAAGLLVLEGYGLTEASPTLTLNRPGAFRFDSVGQALPTVELRLATDGEIQARGPNVFGGYHKDPAASAGAFTEDGWLKTGDLGHFDDEGFLRIIGRKKEILVLTSGKNIPPANVEARFAGDPNVAHAMVYGDGKRYLVAALWPTPGGPTGEPLQALMAERVALANEGLARHETIKRFAIIEEPLTVADGLLTATLKLRRNQIVARFGDRLEALYG